MGNPNNNPGKPKKNWEIQMKIREVQIKKFSYRFSVT
jgi:hypothetical protein